MVSCSFGGFLHLFASIKDVRLLPHHLPCFLFPDRIERPVLPYDSQTADV